MRRIVAALLFLLFLTGRSFAQEGNASITGFIQDSAKAEIPGVSVLVVNTDTNQHFDATTNKDGSYNIQSLPVGPYRMQIEKPGFRTVLKEDVFLHTQDVLQINFQLAVGSTSETVTVSGDSVNVNTTDASVSTVIDRQFVENLPLNGRSFQSLLYITPGVNLNAGGGATGSEGTTGQFVVNGQRGDANYWLVDGVSANVGMDPGTPGAGASGAVGATNSMGGTNAMVSVDALQEFRIATSTYSPEFGRTPGGQISITTRSGTNQFHGTMFEYFRNTALDATDWFADNTGLAKAAEHQNDFGGVLGGPILTNKTFFFFSYEGLRVLQPYTLIGNVPDLESRQIAIPAMKPFLNMYPLPAPGAPDTSPGSGYTDYSATFSNPSSADAYSLRIDHQLTSNLNLFARYQHAPSSFDQRAEDGGSPSNNVDHSKSISKSATLGATWTKSAQVVNDTRFNYTVSGGKATFSTDTFGGGTPTPDVPLFPSPFTYTNAFFALYTEFGTGIHEHEGLFAGNYQHQYNLVNTLSMQKGAHGLKFGVDYRRLTPSYGQAPYQLVPIFPDMVGMETGNCFLIIEHYVNGRFLMQNLGVFAQDTWRINSRFNLTYGLRWDVDYRPTSENGINIPGLTGFSLTDFSNVGLAPAGTPPYRTHYTNIAPRIGGAYRLLTDPDWGLVLRGGFGLFYGLASTEAINADAMDNPLYPFGTNGYYSNGIFPTYPTDPQAQLPPVVPPDATNGNGLFGIDPNLNLPYALEWNVALEQSLGKAQTFSLSWVGAADRRLLASASIANPNPNYSSAYLVAGVGTSNYQALQAEFQRRLTRGLQALVSYTWSHSIDNGSYGAYANGGFANLNANRGDSDFDLRQVFSAAVTYKPPVLKSNFLTRAITSNWSTDDIVQIRSGAPIDINDADFTALIQTNASVLIRPDVVPGVAKYLTGPQYPGRKALNPASFMDPPTAYDPSLGIQVPIRQGNLGRNARRGLGLTQWDFSAHRDFPIYERLKLQFRAELFNILNHPNFGPFNSTFQANDANPFFGQSTQMLNLYLGGYAGNGGQNPLYTPGSARSGEFALKLIF